MRGRLFSGREKQVEEEASLGKRRGVVAEACGGSGSHWGARSSGERSRLRGTEVETGTREEMRALGYRRGLGGGTCVEEAGRGPRQGWGWGGGLITTVRREEEVSRRDC